MLKNYAEVNPASLRFAEASREFFRRRLTPALGEVSPYGGQIYAVFLLATEHTEGTENSFFSHGLHGLTQL